MPYFNSQQFSIQIIITLVETFNNNNSNNNNNNSKIILRIMIIINDYSPNSYQDCMLNFYY